MDTKRFFDNDDFLLRGIEHLISTAYAIAIDSPVEYAPYIIKRLEIVLPNVKLIFSARQEGYSRGAITEYITTSRKLRG